jgi:hypothetical protein
MSEHCAKNGKGARRKGKRNAEPEKENSKLKKDLEARTQLATSTVPLSTPSAMRPIYNKPPARKRHLKPGRKNGHPETGDDVRFHSYPQNDRFRCLHMKNGADLIAQCNAVNKRFFLQIITGEKIGAFIRPEFFQVFPACFNPGVAPGCFKIHKPTQQSDPQKIHSFYLYNHLHKEPSDGTMCK